MKCLCIVVQCETFFFKLWVRSGLLINVVDFWCTVKDFSFIELYSFGFLQDYWYSILIRGLFKIIHMLS